MIAELGEKIKAYGGQIFIVVSVALATTLVAGALRLYQIQHVTGPIRLEKSAFSLSEENMKTGLFVASPNGNRYYPHACKVGNRILEPERVYFDSEVDAQKAGYTRSPSCTY